MPEVNVNSVSSISIVYILCIANCYCKSLAFVILTHVTQIIVQVLYLTSISATFLTYLNILTGTM